MLSLPDFPVEALRSLAAQLGTRPTALSLDAVRSGVNLEVAETFDVYELASNPNATAGTSLRTRAKPTGQWHHQIRHGLESREFALTAPREAPPDRIVEVVFNSDLARQLDSTIDWMDQNADQIPDGTVHVLFVPSLLTHAFWIETADRDFVAVIDQPTALNLLQPQRFYDGDAFLRVVDSTPRERTFVVPVGRAGT